MVEGYVSMVLLCNKLCLAWTRTRSCRSTIQTKISQSRFKETLTRAGPVHRGRPGGPAWPIIPGPFLRRYLGRLFTYFDDINSVLQEIDHSSSLQKQKAKNASYEREKCNVFSYHENSSLLALWCVPGINEHVVSILVTWLMSRLESCETAHELAEDFTLVVKPWAELDQAFHLILSDEVCLKVCLIVVLGLSQTTWTL